MHNPQSALKREEKNKLFKKGEAEQGTVAESIASEVNFCVRVHRMILSMQKSKAQAIRTSKFRMSRHIGMQNHTPALLSK
jgi:hypothetical protein